MSVQHLRSICGKLKTEPIVNKSSPTSQPRRAGVAAILRYHRNHRHSNSLLDISNTARSTEEKQQEEEDVRSANSSLLGRFLDQMANIPGELELLFIQRAKRSGDVWSGQVAFPGGKSEENETDLDTALREVEEEIGLDLSSSDFLHLGKLDDKTITTMENEFMMILVPFVFLQIVPDTPPLKVQTEEVAAVHWVSLHYLLSTPIVTYDPFGKTIPDAQRLLRYPKPGVIQVPSILLPTSKPIDDAVVSVDKDEPIVLWGLTLRITQQLIGFASNQKQEDTMIVYNNNSNGISKSRL